MDDQLDYGLGFSTSNLFTTTLISGAVYNSYALNVYIQVYDMNGAYTSYEINRTITVTPDFVNFTSTTDGLISNSPNLDLNRILMQGSYLNSLQIMLVISSLLNEQSMSDKLGLLLNNETLHFFPRTYGPLSNYAGVVPVIEILHLVFKSF